MKLVRILTDNGKIDPPGFLVGTLILAIPALGLFWFEALIRHATSQVTAYALITIGAIVAGYWLLTALALVQARFQDLGDPPWATLLLFMPILNLYVIARLTLTPWRPAAVGYLALLLATIAGWSFALKPLVQQRDLAFYCRVMSQESPLGPVPTRRLQVTRKLERGIWSREVRGLVRDAENSGPERLEDRARTLDPLWRCPAAKSFYSAAR